MAKLVIDPVTRIEGHLRIEALVEGGEVKEARSSGTMFRGFEIFLKGRDPRDAQQITQRVCGVCPMAHAIASAHCLDSAFGVADGIPKNGRILRNLMLGANFVQSHILHFYHLAAIDYVDVAAAADYDGSDGDLQSVRDFIARGALQPFVPRYEGDYRLSKEQNLAATSDYLKALRIRRIAHEMIALVAGKMPHACIVPGGIAWRPTEEKIAALRAALQGSDIGQIQRSMQELSEALQRVGAAVYQQAGPPPGEEAPPGEEKPPDEGTVEGEFREV